MAEINNKEFAKILGTLFDKDPTVIYNKINNKTYLNDMANKVLGDRSKENIKSDSIDVAIEIIKDLKSS